MLKEFDELVKQRRQLKEWWAGLSKKTYRGDYRTMRVDVSEPVMVAICGQDYAGAPNYHEAPKAFVRAVGEEMQTRAVDIAHEAYRKEIARLDELIAGCKEAVLAELNQEEEQ